MARFVSKAGGGREFATGVSPCRVTWSYDVRSSTMTAERKRTSTTTSPAGQCERRRRRRRLTLRPQTQS